MARCRLHWREEIPCKKCAESRRSATAHSFSASRGASPFNKTPSNNKLRCTDHWREELPCKECAKTQQSASFAPPLPKRSNLPAYGHSHGTASVCHIRCGVNEGLCILNDKPGVDCLFTDSLSGCTQVIFRSDRATFTCHIFSGAKNPVGWIGFALSEFTKHYGAVTLCCVITRSAQSGHTGAIYSALKKTISEIELVLDSGGYAIKVATGEVKTVVPSDWNTNKQFIGGWQTKTTLIDMRLIGPWLGQPQVGDYFESCQTCNQYEEVEF